MIFYSFCAFSVLFALVLSFIYNNAGYTLICIGSIIIYVCQDKISRIEQLKNHQFSPGHLNFDNPKHNLNGVTPSKESQRKSDKWNSPVRPAQYFDLTTRLVSTSNKMWSSPNSKPRPRPRFAGNNPLNSSMPVHLSSPLATRQRVLGNGNLDGSALNLSVSNGHGKQNGHASSPLFSSPFMPQIKRALGLEPTGPNKYKEPRRHSFGIGSLGATFDFPKVAGVLPHVKLTPTRRLSLTERNSSMLNRSSTVKIAPPVAGKALNSSLCQMRNDSSAAEEKSTPDTHAVIIALKERRKRSMNVHEENSDIPAQQAKRRRQESQHSNASTSSLPALSDNLPDLSGTDFNMRLETPGIKRPSRPSQSEMEEWPSSPSVKRVCNEGRNNSILSSLSSSQRFLATQTSKRKAESSFTENEAGNSIKQQRNEQPTQRQEQPKLTHLDINYTPQKSEPVRKKLIADNTEDGIPKTADSADNTKEINKLEESTKKPTLCNVPSMKKTASVYAGLSSKGSFRKAQYANVVATLDDYDSDREAEHERVQQMLKNVDESFPKKPEEKKVPVTTASSVVVSTSVAPTVTTTVSIATSSIAATTTSTASILSNLEKLSQSPIQETGAVGEQPKVSQPSVSFKSLFPASTTSTGTLGTSINTAAGTQSTFTGLGVVQSTSGPAVTTATAPSTTATAVGQGTTTVASPGFKSLFPLGVTQPVPPATSSTLAPGFTYAPSVTSGLPGAITSSHATHVSGTGTSTFQLASSIAMATTTATPTLGQGTAAPSFTFGTQPASSTTGSAPSAGFYFGVAKSSTAASAVTPSSALLTGFSFGTAPSVTSSSASSTAATSVPQAGFAFGTSANAAPATTSAKKTGLAFGMSASVAPAATGFTFGTPSASSSANTSTPATGFGIGSTSLDASTSGGLSTGFSFGSTSQTGSTATPSPFQFNNQSSTAAPGVQSTAAPVFKFGATSTAASSTPATGFTFGAQSGTSTSSAPLFGTSSTSSAAPSPFGASQPSSNTVSSIFGTPLTSQTLFGSQTGSAATGFSFGANQKTTSASTPFAFSAGSATTSAASSVFGTQPAASLTTGFAFGQGSNQSSTGLQFGTNPQSSSVFGATNTASPFGVTASAAPKFSQTNQTPAFGTGATSQATTFGSTNQMSAFGSANQTSAFGSTNKTSAFGSASQTPAFGSANQTPAFGLSNQPSGFGASSNPAPAFGAGFGATTQKANTPVFGASSNSSSSSVFGNTGTPGFGKSQSMPVFGTSDNSSSGFNFGGPAPNVNPFGQGQTTPAKQTGNAFRMPLDTTPKNQTGAMFQFGQSQNNNSSASKGFDFGAGASGSSNTGGFNFSAIPTSGFGTPGATPGAFAVGTGDSAPRPPRTMAKASRRRSMRK